jgi:ATP-binding cassette subfamily B protein IrtB
MIEVIKRRFALSTKGAKDFCKGVFFTTLLDIVLMLPAVFVFLFLEEYLRPVFQPSASVTHGILYYSILGIVFMIVMYIFAVLQYRSTYTTVYDESANRRISLAEKLRKLPLAFFGEKNLSDLTATIMTALISSILSRMRFPSCLLPLSVFCLLPSAWHFITGS